MFGKNKSPEAGVVRERFERAPPSTLELAPAQEAPRPAPSPQLYAKVPMLLIREPKETDIDQIYELGKAIPELASTEDKEWLSKDDVEHYVRYSHSECLVAELQEKIVGFIITQKEGGWEHACIVFLGVHPDFRGEGIGRYLVSQTESKLGTKDIYLLATSANAVDYFSKLGFVQGKTMTYMEKVLKK